jgi:two-component system heavy metal sensor histidine kinase CusS
MSLKPTRSRSIAKRLVVFFTIAAALVLCCGLGVFYWIVVQHATAEDNEVLANKVDALQTEFEGNGGMDAITAEIKSAGRSGRESFFVRLLDSNGGVITQTPDMEILLPTSVFPPPASREIAVPTEHHTADKLFGFTTRRALKNNQQFTLQIAQDRTADERFQKQFGGLLVIVLAIGALTSGLIAITVTRRGLQPLRDMSQSVARVSASHLNERLSPAQWPLEIQPLADAFDKMLARLEDSFTRLSQFSADLAHELRTPIGNILGESQVALTRSRSADEYREVIESTVAECERLAGVVDNLLFLARAEATDRQIQTSQFDARDAAEKIAGYYQTVAEDRKVRITCDGTGQVLADRALFDRAMTNLVDNALRFTPDGGHIHIAVETNTTKTTVAVSDDGSGIAAEHLPHVFDRFYRADPSRSAAGTGLGLSLVKSIVDLHRGAAEIQSEPDRGTTVTLSFPNQA